MPKLADGVDGRLPSQEKRGDGAMGEQEFFDVDVTEMVSVISDDTSFNKSLEERLYSRQIVKSLMAMRAAQGISQSDIAEELECTQSKISKIENGFDADLRLRDLDAYAKVLGREWNLMCPKRGESLAQRVKYHAFSMRAALLQLVELAHKDDEIVRGVAKLHAEAFVNMMKFLQESSSKLPPRPESGEPYIHIVNCENSDIEQSVEDDNSPLAERTAAVQPATSDA